MVLRLHLLSWIVFCSNLIILLSDLCLDLSLETRQSASRWPPSQQRKLSPTSSASQTQPVNRPSVCLRLVGQLVLFMRLTMYSPLVRAGKWFKLEQSYQCLLRRSNYWSPSGGEIFPRVACFGPKCEYIVWDLRNLGVELSKWIKCTLYGYPTFTKRLNSDWLYLPAFKIERSDPVPGTSLIAPPSRPPSRISTRPSTQATEYKGALDTPAQGKTGEDTLSIYWGKLCDRDWHSDIWLVRFGPKDVSGAAGRERDSAGGSNVFESESRASGNRCHNHKPTQFWPGNSRQLRWRKLVNDSIQF